MILYQQIRKKFWLKFKAFWNHQIFPESCLICQENIGKVNCCSIPGICRHCWGNLPRSGTIFTEIELHERKCPLLFPFFYRDHLAKAIKLLKFRQKFIWANFLAESLLQENIQPFYQNHFLPEVIIPIPLSHRRFRERGFNQSLEISKTIAAKLALPIDTTSFIRQKETEKQSTLSAIERSRNIKNAFTAQKQPSYKHVAILDDVFTTGNTIKSFTQTLFQSGIQKVDIWVAAKD